MEKQKLTTGQLVQLNPDTVGNKAFAGTIMVVTEPKSWGAKGYVQSLGTHETPGGQGYYRANWDEMELVGLAVWVI